MRRFDSFLSLFLKKFFNCVNASEGVMMVKAYISRKQYEALEAEGCDMSWFEIINPVVVEGEDG